MKPRQDDAVKIETQLTVAVQEKQFSERQDNGEQDEKREGDESKESPKKPSTDGNVLL